MKRAVLVLAIAALTASSGCTPRSFGTAVAIGGILAVAAATDRRDSAVLEEDAEIRERQRTWARPDVYVVREASPRDGRDEPAAPKARGFDTTKARVSLGEIDTSACKGAPRGVLHGHARVTFAPSGAVTKVLIDEPSALPVEVVSCVGAALGKAQVPAFDGAALTVGTSYRLP